MTSFQQSTLIASLMFVLGGGTIFFRFVEGWRWVDAYFFTVVTISTVGYGNLVPETDAGKIGATVLIFGGLGVFAIAVHQFSTMHLKKREEHSNKVMEHIEKQAQDHKNKIANNDSSPSPLSTARQQGK